jgi:hypothetical protein
VLLVSNGFHWVPFLKGSSTSNIMTLKMNPPAWTFGGQSTSKSQQVFYSLLASSFTNDWNPVSGSVLALGAPFPTVHVSLLVSGTQIHRLRTAVRVVIFQLFLRGRKHGHTLTVTYLKAYVQNSWKHTNFLIWRLRLEHKLALLLLSDRGQVDNRCKLQV